MICLCQEKHWPSSIPDSKPAHAGDEKSKSDAKEGSTCVNRLSAIFFRLS